MHVSRTPGLLLQPIESNPGILPIKEGQALVSNDKWTLVKILDLSFIREDLEFNKNRYADLDIHVKKYFAKKLLTPEINDMKMQTDYIRNITIEKLNQLLPAKRSKRGILNPLGSLIKVVTGNLDNDDAVRYDAMIEGVKTGQNTVNKKITVIAEMMESVINIANSTKYNFIRLDKAVWNIGKELKDTNATLNELKLINVYSLFLHNFEMLYVRLDEIETTIAFSKLGTLHQSLIDTDELLSLLKLVELKSKLVYPVTFENILKMEKCISLKVFAKENQITFIIDIPLIEIDQFTYYRIIPIPITNPYNQTSLVLPKYPYLLMKGLKSVSLLHPCREIEDSLYLCEEDYSPLLMKDSCIIELMNYATNTTQCRPILVEFDDVKIEKIQRDRWMLYTKTTLLISKTCDNEVTRYHLRGTYIITADDDCEVQIKGVKLKRHSGNIEEIRSAALPIISLPEVRLPTTSPAEARPVNLDGVDLTDLRLLSHVLTKSESVSVSHSESGSVINVKDVSIGTLLLYVFLVIVILLYCKNYVYDRFRDSRGNHQDDSPDNFETGMGEVMHSGSRQDFVVINA